MTIRITPNFTLRRVAGRLTATIVDQAFAASIVLTAAQAKDAAEAFNIMAVMLDAGGDESDKDETELEEAA